MTFNDTETRLDVSNMQMQHNAHIDLIAKQEKCNNFQSFDYIKYLSICTENTVIIINKN